jgi:hypothetical protein
VRFTKVWQKLLAVERSVVEEVVFDDEEEVIVSTPPAHRRRARSGWSLVSIREALVEGIDWGDITPSPAAVGWRPYLARYPQVTSARVLSGNPTALERFLLAEG